MDYLEFYQNAWLKAYIGMNTDLGRKAKNDFGKDFLNLMNNAAFGKTIENVRKHRDMKLVTTGRKRNYLVSQSNYHTPKFFTEHLLAIEMKITQILMSKPVYLGLSTLEISKKKIAEDVESNNSNYELERPLTNRKK